MREKSIMMMAKPIQEDAARREVDKPNLISRSTKTLISKTESQLMPVPLYRGT